MAEITDEVVLNIDGFCSVDPELGFRRRSQDFIDARKWATIQVGYADQPEPDSPQPWSMAFNLGLDHVRAGAERWFEDVAALLRFVEDLQQELNNEFVVDIRFRSVPWYSDHVAFINGGPLEIEPLRTYIQVSANSPPQDQPTIPPEIRKPWWKLW